MHRPNTHDGSMGSYPYSRRAFSTGLDLGEQRTTTPLYKYRGGGSAFLSKSSLHEEPPRAPAVGLYNVQRLLDDSKVNSNDIYGHKLTSSFKSSGRSKPLMMDAVHYATMGSDWKTTNLGPGSYDFPDRWSCDERHIVNLVSTRGLKTASTEKLRESLGLNSTERPWREVPVMRPGLAKKSAVKAMGSQYSGDGSEVDQKERMAEIMSVRSLPYYQ